MLENDMYDSWKSIMDLYMMNREHGRMILESVENGRLIWPLIEKNRQSSKGASNYGGNRNSTSHARELLTKKGKRVRQRLLDVGTTRTYTPGASGSNSGKQRTVIFYNYKGEGHMSTQCTKPKRKHDNSWFKDKVLLVQAQASGQILHEKELSFLADLGILEDALAEVHNHDNMNNNMLNQAVQAMSSSEQSNVVTHSETEINSDSNIIPYSQYVIESQQAAIQNSNSSAQQDALILSVIEQLKTQVVNCTKINLDNKSVNDTLTAELERYKEQVKVLKEGQNVDLRSNDTVSDSSAQSVEIDHLKQTLSEHLKEKESLMQTVTLLKNDFKKEESRNIDREIALEKKIKQLDKYLKLKLEPKLYDGNVIKNTSAIVIPDSEETLMLAEESPRHGLVQGLPKLKFKKDNLCSACAMVKSLKKPHIPKSEDTNQEKLYLLHIDLCGPMLVASVYGKISSWRIYADFHILDDARDILSWLSKQDLEDEQIFKKKDERKLKFNNKDLHAIDVDDDVSNAAANLPFIGLLKLLGMLCSSSYKQELSCIFQQSDLDDTLTRSSESESTDLISVFKLLSPHAPRPFTAGWKNHAARHMTRPSSHYFQHFSRPGYYNQMYMDEGRWGTAENPQKNKDLGIVDSSCSRSMIGNKEKLDDFVKIVGGTVVLRVPRKNNLYYFNLSDIKPVRDVTYFLAKASLVESTKWHRRMAHVNFKNMTSWKHVILPSGKHDHHYYSLVLQGIRRDYSNARTPQQNGVAERKNRTLIEAARTMLADSKLPTMFWTEAVSIACYVLNRVLMTKPINRPLNSGLGKFPTSVILNLLGVFKKIEETLNLRYLEDKPNVQGLGHEWYFDLDYLTDSLGYTRFKTNQPAGPKVNEASEMMESTSRNRVPAGEIDSTAGISNGPHETITPIVKLVPTDAQSLPPGHSLGSSAHSTRYPSPSDLANSMSSSSEI
ncbi:retrovirus-related pol polyprotein from transposon TNT 1-94, partial [Tanacetum coccineum]